MFDILSSTSNGRIKATPMETSENRSLLANVDESRAFSFRQEKRKSCKETIELFHHKKRVFGTLSFDLESSSLQPQ